MIICSSSGAGITVKCRYYKRVEEQGGRVGWPTSFAVEQALAVLYYTALFPRPKRA